MDIGLLLLRLLLGGLLAGHGAQKMFGAFGGFGPAGTAPAFEGWGLRPGQPLVRLAATCELLAALLLVLGLLTSLGAAIALGTMLVAAWVNAAKGLWAAKGGYELPLVYGGIAVVLGFTGPGAWALDQPLGLDALTGVGGGVAAAACGVLVGLCWVGYARAHRQPQLA
jgi:putative oxidoreductase